MSRLLWCCYAIVAFWVSGILSKTLPGHAAAVFVGSKFIFLLPACIYLYRRIGTPKLPLTRNFDVKLALLLAVWCLFFMIIHVSVENIRYVPGLLAYSVVTTVAMVAIEELIFRGITFSNLSEASSIRWEQYTSSFYFAVLHAFNFLYTGQLGDTLSQIIMAFRYVFPGESTDVKRIESEATTFHFPAGTRAWLQPKTEAQSGWGQTNPYYEAHYESDIPVGTPSPGPNGWIYPALFRTGDTWLLLKEADLGRTYSGTALQQESPGGE